jgi:hypothetical protein
MSLSAKARRAPLRAVTGAFVLNTGLSKLKAGEEQAKAVHGMAVGTYPFLAKVQPKVFIKGLAVGEVVVGGVVLAPFVSPVVAGAALAGFSGALLNLYWKTPGLHEPGDPRPTQQGTPIAKDVWMLAIGTGLVVDAALTESKVTGIESRAHARAAVRAEVKAEAKAARRAARRARAAVADKLPG